VSLSILAASCPTPSHADDNSAVEPLKTRTFHVAVEDNTGYLAVTAGLKIVDLSDPSNPNVLSTVVLPQSASGCVVDDNIAYVAQGPAGVYIVDASDTSAPKVIAHIPTTGSAMAVDIDDDVLAIANGSVGVALIDVSDPKHPRSAWSSNPAGYVRGLKFYEDRLYVCAGSSGLLIIEVGEDAIGTVVAETQTAGDARDVDFYRQVGFVADGRFGVSVIKLGDGKPSLANTFPTEDLAHGVAFHKGFVFVADGLRGVASYEFAKPTGLNHHQRLDTNDGYADRVTVYDRKLFVANDYMGMLVFDIHSPRTPKVFQ